jgi:polyphosphate:AMP phosphotransferase
MFETAELGRKVGKSEYEQAVPELRTRLLDVQNELRVSRDFAVLVIVAGLDAAGKGETVNTLHEWMDPRFLETHAFGPPTDEERERPPGWRFLRVLPPKGKIGIFFSSWYTEPLVRYVRGQINEAELERLLNHIIVLEKSLADNGTLLVKFWLHLSKKAQKRRLQELSDDPQQSWRVTKQDWKNHKRYDQIIAAADRIVRETSTGEAPWTIVEGADARYRELTVGRELLATIVRRQQRAQLAQGPSSLAPGVWPPSDGQPTILDHLDLSQSLDNGEYKDALASWQARLNGLCRRAQEEGVSTVLVFEGWDAAGKGGAIRRVAQAMDARWYRIVPIGSPSDEERARHYMWRFWRQLPRAGQMTIFDRSWYGRVLVERVEGFAREGEWRRAYKEINEFEELLRQHGIALAKFWLHIDKDEQWRRFQEREQTAYKRFKIGPDDYRNREKWDSYKAAVNEMIERTSTFLAPWTLVESNDKRFARVKILRTICERMEEALSGRS